MTNTFYYDDMQEFDSTFAEKAYYSKNGELILITTGGNELMYSDVPQQVWHDLIEADSTGTFFQSHVRGVYPYQGESPYYFFQRNSETPDPTETPIEIGGSRVTDSDGNVLLDASNSHTNVYPPKIEVGSIDFDDAQIADIVRRTMKTPNEIRESLPSSSDDSGREYVVSATFKTFEEAHVLFSYAEAAAQHASLSVYNSEEVK